jgi:excisionase family DNA binding protein
MEQLYTINNVADLFQVTPKTIYKWMEEGRLEYVIVGSRRRIRQSNIDAFIKASTAQQKPPLSRSVGTETS